MPPWEAALPRGVKEEDILPKRYETFMADNGWVQRVRCSLLGLETRTTPSREDINTSECFVPRAAASESDLPDVITDHWLPILREEGILVECSPEKFTATADWVPLYTQEGLERYLSMALSSFASTGAPQLTAVVPLECCASTDKEFLLSNFHWQSFTIGGRCRQLAFCPYCGVINENSNTALSHVRKHLNLQFVCGGCYSKSFLNGPALHRHMRTQCPSVTASETSPEPPGGRTPWESLTNHTRLRGVEPWDFCLPGCRPYVGGGASNNNIFTIVDLS